MVIGVALVSTEAAGAAAMALRDLCEACGTHLSSYTDALMQLYQQVQSAGALASSGGGFTLVEDDVEQVSALCRVLVPGCFCLNLAVLLAKSVSAYCMQVKAADGGCRSWKQ